MKQQAINLLKHLISTPSFSREEDKTAKIINDFLQKNGVETIQTRNNVWCKSKFFDAAKPTILLNSHHDTVKPVQGWTRNPFESTTENGILYGLGSNDAGASLVSLMAAFLHFYNQKLPFNLIFAATAEEEISGANGIALIKNDFGKIAGGIVGEPTEMKMAIAEKGLMVVDGIAHGKAGHAAREEGVNALYIALEDIDFIRNYEFAEVSELLGKTKMSVTQIEAGTQHNVVPDTCKFVMDIRTTEKHTNQGVFEFLQKNTQSELKARSFRLNSSGISLSHPLVKSGLSLGLEYFGSSTLSDQALLDFPTIKMGVGKSERSHTADEFIYLKEIEEGIDGYVEILERLEVEGLPF
jgi:acetylornithine deacetylase